MYEPRIKGMDKNIKIEDEYIGCLITEYNPKLITVCSLVVIIVLDEYLFCDMTTKYIM